MRKKATRMKLYGCFDANIFTVNRTYVLIVTVCEIDFLFDSQIYR